MQTDTDYFTVGDHVFIANAIKDARDAAQMVTRIAPLRHPLHRDAARLLAALEQLRAGLDNVLWRQVPDRLDPRDMTGQVYAGDERFKPRGYEPPEAHRDAFSPWTVER